MALRREAAQHYMNALNGLKGDGGKRKQALKKSMLALDEFIHPGTICSDVNLGVREIRLDRVVGPQYRSRGHMFQGDFIPNVDEETEFADKWISLCHAQMEEGIRDPIKVYEYLNYYYVQEGNKRVSVLKYFGAVTVRAKVIRVITPFVEEDKKSKDYYDFLDFYNKTDYEDIWISEGHHFNELIDLMYRRPDLLNYKDYLKSYYVPFRRLYKKLEHKYTEFNGLTTGDVFLTYCTMFSEDQIQEDLVKKRLREVLHQASADKVVEVHYDSKEAFSDRINMPTMHKLKVAFVFPDAYDHNSWFEDHYRGMEQMRETYSNQMTITGVEKISEVDPYEVLKALCEKKYDIIFLTGDQNADVAKKCAVDYPKTTFLLCSFTEPSYLLPNYYGKTYQTDYLLGLYTAMKFGHETYGYVTQDRTARSYRAFRSFEEGLRSVQPRVKILPVYEEKDLGNQIKVAAYYGSIPKSDASGDTVNTYVKVKGSETCYAYTYWDWQRFYEKIFARLLDGSFRKLREIHKGASNMLFFHWGLSTGVIGIKTPEGLESKGASLVYEHIKKDIDAGRLDLGWLASYQADEW